MLTGSARKAIKALESYDRPWHVAGGWAIDLFLGRPRREHKDIDIAVLRGDQARLADVLRTYPMFHLIDHQFFPWDGAPLQRPEFQLFVDGERDGSNAWEFLVEDLVRSEWVYRRDPLVRLATTRAFCRTAEGVPYLTPEIVLLYKSKHLNETDQADFNDALPSLGLDGRLWLAEAIRRYNPDHPWLGTLGLAPSENWLGA